MKKLLATAVLSICSLNTYAACSFTHHTSPDVITTVKQNGGWKLSDKKCALMNKHNLALTVDGNATVLSNVSIAWASVRLESIDNHISSSTSGINTNVNTSVASMSKSNELMYDAISSAIEELDFEKAIAEINQFRSNRRNSSNKNM